MTRRLWAKPARMAKVVSRSKRYAGSISGTCSLARLNAGTFILVWMQKTDPASIWMSGTRLVSRVSVWVLMGSVRNPPRYRRGREATPGSGEEAGGAQHAIGFDDLFQ